MKKKQKLFNPSRLEKLVEESGATWTHIAKKIGVSKVTIHAWKVGRVEPSIKHLLALAKFFNVEFEHFLNQ